MVRYVVDTVDKKGAKVRAKASNRGTVLGTYEEDKVFDGERVPGFVKIKDSPLGPDAFIFVDDTKEVEPSLTPIHLFSAQHRNFCTLVTSSAREYGPDRDYLMAVAYHASKNLMDMGTVAEPGPFRITAREWTEAITGIAKHLKLVDADRMDWRLQPSVAALRAADAARKLKPDLGDFPNYTELYFGQRLGDLTAAGKILKGDRALKCKDVIADAVAQGSAYAASLKEGEQSVVEALTDLKKGLVDGLAEALKVIDEMPPDIRFFAPNETDAPWMAIALQEEARDVAEIPGEQSNDRIVLYHKAAGITSQADTDTIPWCASFVTFCMRETGIPEIEASPPKVVDGKGPAWAPRWDTWGSEECNPGEAPVGAVITVKTGGAETGHVGFLAAPEEPGSQFIQLLGGNQGARDRSKPDQVNTTRFPVSSIMHRRWLAGAWGGGGPGITGAQFHKIFRRCPNPDEWAQVITDAWRRFKIVSKAARAGFLGITGNETGDFTKTGRESMHYDLPRAQVVFAKARESAETTAAKIAAGDEAFANWIYADRNGNGNEASGDGWKYRGTGIIQLTGRGNFELCAHKAQLDIPEIVDDPDKATEPALSARIAAWYMHNRKIIDGIGGNEVQFTSAALKVGLPPDDDARKNRLNIRARAMANLT